MNTEVNKPTSESPKKSIHAGHRERIRTRYRQSGMDDFAPHEVLEYVLTFAMPRGDVNETAHYLINHFGSFAAVLDATEDELLACPGVGDVTVCMLKSLPDIFRRYTMDKVDVGEPFDTSDKIGDYLHARYVGLTHERVYLLLFDNGMRMIDCCLIGDGAINCAAVTIRKIAELCLFNHAACAVLAHNHPRGLTLPSGADLDITRTVDAALETIGVQLLEHFIVTENSFATLLRNQKGVLRSSPITGLVDEAFYRNFYGETKER